MKRLLHATGIAVLFASAYAPLVACDDASDDQGTTEPFDAGGSDSNSPSDGGGGGGDDAAGDGGVDAGGRGFKSLSLAYRGAARPEVLAVGEDDDLYWGYPTGSVNWQWRKLPRTGAAQSAPDAVSWSNTRIDYAVVGDCRGNTGTTCQAYWEDVNAADGGPAPEWSTEFDLGEPAGGLKSTVVLASPALSRLFLFGLATDDTAHARYWNGGAWSAWEPVPGSPTFVSLDAIASSSSVYETTTILGRDSVSGALATATHVRPIPTGTAEWLGWSTLPPLANSTGRATITRRIDIGLDPLVVYARGGTSGKLHRTRGSLEIDGTSMWQDWAEVSGGPSTVGDPDCASPGQALIAGGANARDICGVIGPNGSAWIFMTVDGTTFDWTELPLHD